MLEKKIFANGQKVYDLVGEELTYYYKSGTLKARGAYKKNQKQGLWQYYREDGHLWKEGNYKDGDKHGLWQEYSTDGQVEHETLYDTGKLIKE